MAKNKVNEDLVRERKNASFNIKELTNFLDGSKEKTNRRKELEQLFYNDPELQDKVPVDYLSHSEIYDDALRKSLHIFHRAMELADPQEILSIADAILQEASPLTVHFVMFIPTLMGLATEDQQAKWLPDALEMKIIGTYAQTELGHGTFLRGLETTSTYDPTSEEFVLNTPTLSSVKWWPGSLGKTANFAIVLAQLCTKGKSYGIHPFMVQIRSLDNHQPLSGITVGEIGPKVGFKASDNGFLKLDNVRIPRENMLMKNAQVTPSGEYIKPKSDKLNYGTMVFVRVLILDMVSYNIARAATIAIRYSAIRRQAQILPNEPEVQILDYQAQQYKLLPMVAFSHACKATFIALMDTYKTATQNMEKGDLATLPELHATSSGLKALCTDNGSAAIEICRRACGGHGYLQISGIHRIYAATVAACTYEGENTVLYLQTARYIMKVLKGQQPVARNSVFGYLLEDSKSIPSRFEYPPSLETLVGFYRAAAQKMTIKAAARVQNFIDAGKLPEIAWNLSHVDLILCAKAHVQYYIVQKYMDWVLGSPVPNNLKEVLKQLCYLYMLQNIHEQSGIFMMIGLSEIQLSKMHDYMLEMLNLLRPNAVALVDAFDFHDLVLNSPLGCFDGNVYERLYELAQKTPMNQKQVHESYYKYLQPVMKSKL
ncbi:peroxisomal acyl-coenzyme A oxidase 1 [Parasteatoda tepidariorum]|uniref:peroxisomal acyl-coenzyme A oxidase 1 n=1 Tax=Parasteatoda tepidariorum TaxID=114398 RepID=UPI00077FAD34|nr:peroxisomal acyl-coenzyme A oxidase 1 isoform X2 [Parasteatoda tepidariorum]XP_042906100.1 peroxisomal acyl-coenzyme A oxidase 1 isoform X1 [Parasteatoda tepidariorum]